MGYVPDVLSAASSDGFTLRTLSASEECPYVSSTAHGVPKGTCLGPVPRHSRTTVFGLGHTSDESEWLDFSAPIDRPGPVHDAGLYIRASAGTRRIFILTPRGGIPVAVSVGQVLYAVITATCPAVGLMSARYRVTGLERRYAARSRGSGYDQATGLGGVWQMSTNFLRPRQ